MTNQTKNAQSVKPNDLIRIGQTGASAEHNCLALVIAHPVEDRYFGARLLEGAWAGVEVTYNYDSDFEIVARAIEPAPLEAYREGDEFPNVGYVRRLTGQDRVEKRAA